MQGKNARVRRIRIAASSYKLIVVGDQFKNSDVSDFQSLTNAPKSAGVVGTI
ncbi:MAG: hypothetical protein ACTHMB_10050 [Candidatus Binatia bacterium]